MSRCGKVGVSELQRFSCTVHGSGRYDSTIGGFRAECCFFAGLAAYHTLHSAKVVGPPESFYAKRKEDVIALRFSASNSKAPWEVRSEIHNKIKLK